MQISLFFFFNISLRVKRSAPRFACRQRGDDKWGEPLRTNLPVPCVSMCLCSIRRCVFDLIVIYLFLHFLCIFPISSFYFQVIKKISPPVISGSAPPPVFPRLPEVTLLVSPQSCFMFFKLSNGTKTVNTQICKKKKSNTPTHTHTHTVVQLKKSKHKIKANLFQFSFQLPEK